MFLFNDSKSSFWLTALIVRFLTRRFIGEYASSTGMCESIIYQFYNMPNYYYYYYYRLLLCWVDLVIQCGSKVVEF